MRCADLLAHALQCIFIRARRSAAAVDRGGRLTEGGEGWREEDAKGMKDEKSGKKKQKSKKTFVTGAKKKIKSQIKFRGCESDLWKHSGGVRGSAESPPRSEVPVAVYHRGCG